MGWGRESYSGRRLKSHHLCTWFNSRMGDALWIIIDLFVSDVNPGNEHFMCKRVVAKIFLRGPKDCKVLLRSSANCSKRMFFGSGVWGCVEFVVAGKNCFYVIILSRGKQWEILLVAISECCLYRMLTAKSQSGRGASRGAASSYMIVLVTW